MQECSALEDKLEETTGAVKAIQPSSGGGGDVHRTSSGLMLLQSMAHEKIKLNLSMLERQVFEPLLEKFYDLNLQFLTPGYKIFDPEGKSAIYSPEMIAGCYEFRAKGARYALDMQMKQMNIRATVDALGTSGLPLGELHIKLWMRLYDNLGFEDKAEVEKILRAEIDKFNKQQQAIAQAKAGGAPGGGMPAGDPIRDLSALGLGADNNRSDGGNFIPGGY
jgi:hypothetical protein